MSIRILDISKGGSEKAAAESLDAGLELLDLYNDRANRMVSEELRDLGGLCAWTREGRMGAGGVDVHRVVVDIIADIRDRGDQALIELEAKLDKVELTAETIRLGAVQGIVVDADGSTQLFDWPTLLGQSIPTELDFDLDAASPASGVLRKKCNQVKRKVLRGLKGLGGPGVSIVGLCGDAFWDDFTAHGEVREIFLDGSDRPLDIVWSDTTHWQAVIPIGFGDNQLTFEARDFQGDVIGSRTITAHSTNPNRPLQQFLRITELNYNPPEPSASESLAGFDNNDDFEFIELTNIGPLDLDLTDVRFTVGIDFNFTAAGITALAPGEYVVLARDPNAFAERYGDVPNPIGPYTGGFSNGGERLLLVDPVGGVIHDFTYGDSGTAGWPDRADGNGSALQIVDTAGDYNDPANWGSSSEYLGSPGSAGAAAYQDVVINEVLSHTDAPTVDAIELY
ncbi:hypothetical protein LCGC14_2423950, partial [marine sediment metagenome]